MRYQVAVVLVMDLSIEVVDVWKKYVVREGLRRRRVVEALRGITFFVRRGTIHALLGPNGAGKTTTVKILATLLLPDSGTVRVLGRDVVKEASEVRKYIGLVLDVSKGFYMSLSGYENLVFYGLLRGMSFSDARRRAREVLELVGLEGMGASGRPYYSYSLGMRARLAIAKALLTNPEVLLLDEPTLGLDVESARMVRDLMTRLAREGRTILVTGHNMYEIEQIANYVTIINKGKVVVSGSPDELKERLGLLHKVSIKVSGSEVSRFVSELRSNLPIEGLTTNYLGSAVLVTTYVRSRREDIARLVFKLSKALDVKVLDFSIVEPSLEDAYLAVVRGGGGG